MQPYLFFSEFALPQQVHASLEDCERCGQVMGCCANVRLLLLNALPPNFSVDAHFLSAHLQYRNSSRGTGTVLIKRLLQYTVAA